MHYSSDITEIADFGPIADQDVTFSEGTTGQQCFSISIRDEEILENTEVFRVLIRPTDDPALRFGNSVLNVGIENEDSTSIAQFTILILIRIHHLATYTDNCC